MTTQELLGQVVATAANTYRWTDHGPISTEIAGALLSHSIYLPKLRRFETAVSGLEAVSIKDMQTFETFRREGIEVWILVPLASIGKAHKHLRDYADRIQSWWLDDTSQKIKFGTAETP
ncbi:MAG TPA: hypothetical protein VM425_16250 [Myxococcota bacterium]|nr:hypothetical protein [Myxococcota bacterium]